MKIILEAEHTLMVLIYKSKVFLPAANLPIVSNRLFVNGTNSKNQCSFSKNLKSVSSTAPGKSMYVTAKLNIRA